MFDCGDLEQMPEGGYCFGNKTYIRDQLRELVDGDILVMNARKVGMNVDPRACVILYQGRNITASLTDALMRENRLKIAESGDLLFCSGKQAKDWTIWDLERSGGYFELKQPFWKLQENILGCLRKCDSFKGEADQLCFKESDYEPGPDRDGKMVRYVSIYDGRSKYSNNITNSLIEKLIDLELLYEKGGVYLPRDSAEADVGGDYQAVQAIFNLLKFFIPLLAAAGLVWMFFGNVAAVLLLAGGTVYYAVMRYRVSHYTRTQRRKGENLEERILYIVKWAALAVLGLYVGVILLNGIGFLAPVLILLYAVGNYKKRYGRH